MPRECCLPGSIRGRCWEPDDRLHCSEDTTDQKAPLWVLKGETDTVKDKRKRSWLEATCRVDWDRYVGGKRNGRRKQSGMGFCYYLGKMKGKGSWENRFRRLWGGNKTWLLVSSRSTISQWWRDEVKWLSSLSPSLSFSLEIKSWVQFIAKFQEVGIMSTRRYFRNDVETETFSNEETCCV